MKRFKNILYVADGAIVVNAFHHAVGLAERNQAQLTVMLVLEPIPPYLTRLTPHLLRQARIRETEAALDRLCEWVSGRVQVERKIVEGKAFLEIIREVLRNNRDLVIKPVEGDSSALRQLFGTTDMHLLRKCPCPVWLIKSIEPGPIQRVLACVDFNELDPTDQDTAEDPNRKILEMAASLSHIEQSEFHVVHAWEAIAEGVMRSLRSGLSKEEADKYVEDCRLEHRHWLDRLLRKAKKWIGPDAYDIVKPKTHVPKGRARDVIPELARQLNIDLVVMGTVARTGIPGLIIGNTAEGILSQIDCSVLAVKPAGFVSPVELE